ncbi:MAG TPA: universal stress protein [Pseudonocardiaceae bacterium]|jgi:nucleotide-binding universal stress UspA family protein|nr:universal stress protein [Pseudonocardiaceae bacterium]
MTRVVVWLTEGTWAACVDAASRLAPEAADFVLLHVLDATVGEALHGAYGGLLGRAGHDPGDVVDQLAGPAEEQLLTAAAERLGRPAERWVRAGEIEREVVAACADADVLVCARDGAADRLGPRSLGRHTRFVVDHAPCAVLLIWPDEVPELDSIPPKPPRPPRG